MLPTSCGRQLTQRLNILGRGIGWSHAPSNELTWGVTLVNLHRSVDLVIDMNVYEDGRWGNMERDGAKKSKQLAENAGIPYICLDNYPLQTIIDYFKTDYFSNTVDYALALAIYQGFKSIDLWGINMANSSEYAYQKAGVHLWIGMAMGKGIEVNIHGLSAILKTPDGMLYGYDIPQRKDLQCRNTE